MSRGSGRRGRSARVARWGLLVIAALNPARALCPVHTSLQVFIPHARPFLHRMAEDRSLLVPPPACALPYLQPQPQAAPSAAQQAADAGVPAPPALLQPVNGVSWHFAWRGARWGARPACCLLPFGHPVPALPSTTTSLPSRPCHLCDPLQATSWRLPRAGSPSRPAGHAHSHRRHAAALSRLLEDQPRLHDSAGQPGSRCAGRCSALHLASQLGCRPGPAAQASLLHPCLPPACRHAR